MQRLTFDTTQDNSSPVWSPDGTRIAFGSQRNGRWGLYVKPVDGTAPEELIVESEIAEDADQLVSGWEIDRFFPGHQPATGCVDGSGGRRQETVSARAVVSSRRSSGRSRRTANGSRISRTRRAALKSTSSRFRKVPVDGRSRSMAGHFPRWRGDGKELYFVLPPTCSPRKFASPARHSIRASRVSLFGLAQPSTNLAHASYNRFAVTADGQRFLISQPTGGGGVVAGGGLSDAIIASVDRGGASARFEHPTPSPSFSTGSSC